MLTVESTVAVSRCTVLDMALSRFIMDLVPVGTANKYSYAHSDGCVVHPCDIGLDANFFAVSSTASRDMQCWQTIKMSIRVRFTDIQHESGRWLIFGRVATTVVTDLLKDP